MLSDSDSVKHFFSFTPGMLLKVMSTLPLLLVFVETWSLSNNSRNINFLIVLSSVNLCKIFWSMSEACEIAQPVGLKL